MYEGYQALLLVSFGGPEQPDDVMPFLENVLRGKNVPRPRMLEVAEHYYEFGGVSPINEQNRQLIAALERELADARIDLPIYWGNRNWHPLLPDVMRTMRDEGVTKCLAFVTSAFSCYSGCRQYREDIRQRQEAIGDDAPEVGKLRVFHNHPGFIDAMADRVRAALGEIPASRHGQTLLVYTAHSIPLSMAEGCAYVDQLRESSRLVSEAVGHPHMTLTYQSRSGPPHQPWLGPDVCDYLRVVHHERRFSDVVIVPIGFTSDHMEVLFDLDTEARALCQQLPLNMVRAKTVGTHPTFVRMIRQLIEERAQGGERPALGKLGPNPDQCLVDCCLPGASPARPRGPKIGQPRHSPVSVVRR